MARLFSNFSYVAAIYLPDELPPLYNIEHAIDLVLESQLSNLPIYYMNAREHIELKSQVDKLLLKGFK